MKYLFYGILIALLGLITGETWAVVATGLVSIAFFSFLGYIDDSNSEGLPRWHSRLKRK